MILVKIFFCEPVSSARRIIIRQSVSADELPFTIKDVCIVCFHDFMIRIFYLVLFINMDRIYINYPIGLETGSLSKVGLRRISSIMATDFAK